MRLAGAFLGLSLAAASAGAQTAPAAPGFVSAWEAIAKARASAEEFLTSTDDLMADGNVTTACSMANQARIKFDEIAAALKALPPRPRDAPISAADFGKAKADLAARHAHVKRVYKEACA